MPEIADDLGRPGRQMDFFQSERQASGLIPKITKFGAKILSKPAMFFSVRLADELYDHERAVQCLEEFAKENRLPPSIFILDQRRRF